MVLSPDAGSGFWADSGGVLFSVWLSRLAAADMTASTPSSATSEQTTAPITRCSSIVTRRGSVPRRSLRDGRALPRNRQPLTLTLASLLRGCLQRRLLPSQVVFLTSFRKLCAPCGGKRPALTRSCQRGRSLLGRTPTRLTRSGANKASSPALSLL